MPEIRVTPLGEWGALGGRRGMALGLSSGRYCAVSPVFLSPTSGEIACSGLWAPPPPRFCPFARGPRLPPIPPGLSFLPAPSFPLLASGARVAYSLLPTQPGGPTSAHRGFPDLCNVKKKNK